MRKHSSVGSGTLPSSTKPVKQKSREKFRAAKPAAPADVASLKDTSHKAARPPRRPAKPSNGVTSNDTVAPAARGSSPTAEPADHPAEYPPVPLSVLHLDLESEASAAVASLKVLHALLSSRDINTTLPNDLMLMRSITELCWHTHVGLNTALCQVEGAREAGVR